ncbi:MAG: hypothetical protein ACFFE2_13175 [Candidatus Thorarchaeota archaeon]
MRKSFKIMTLGIAMLLVAGFFSPAAIAAAYTWGDNFNDGDYDNWTVLYGQFSAADFYLNTFMSPLGINTIYHSSLCAYGNWVFERWENVTDQHTFFISTNWNTTIHDAYSVSVEYGTISNLTLYRWDGEISTVIDQTTIVPEAPGEFHFYNISRTTSGHFDVLRDGVLELSADDNVITTSEYFIYSLDGIGAIDNIFVACDAATGCGLCTTTYIVIIIFLVIVIGILVVKWRPK